MNEWIRYIHDQRIVPVHYENCTGYDLVRVRTTAFQDRSIYENDTSLYHHSGTVLQPSVALEPRRQCTQLNLMGSVQVGCRCCVHGRWMFRLSAIFCRQCGQVGTSDRNLHLRTHRHADFWTSCVKQIKVKKRFRRLGFSFDFCSVFGFIGWLPCHFVTSRRYLIRKCVNSNAYCKLRLFFWFLKCYFSNFSHFVSDWNKLPYLCSISCYIDYVLWHDSVSVFASRPTISEFFLQVHQI